MSVLKYQLKNGLNVILVPNRKSPVVSVQMWVRTGSADEHPAVSGISHFIEHLVFKGTEKYGVGEIAATVEGAGGELNAYTSFDQTVFYVTIASSQTDLALDVVSQMMGHPSFDPEEIDREREVVIEEIKRGLDSPGRRGSQLMFSTAFKKHAYRRPVIGTEKIIRDVSVQSIKKYFHDRYCAKNMFLVVAGDFANPEMKKKVQSVFGLWSDHAPRLSKRVKEPKASGVRVKVEKSEFQEAQLSLAWRIPSVTHSDVPALDVIALILGQGDSSRLVQRLRIDEPLVTSVGASAFTPQNDGLFMVSLHLEEKDADRAMTIVAEEIAKLRDLGPAKDELAKAITCLASEQIYSMETVDGLSRSYGSMEFYLRDPNAFSEYLENLQGLTVKRLRDVCRKYIKSDAFVVTGLTPQKPEVIKKAVTLFKKEVRKKSTAKAFAGAEKASSVVRFGKPKPSKEEPKIIEKKLPGGGWLLLRPQKDTPTVSMRVAFGGGMHLEPAGLDGLTELYSRVWSGGTSDYSEQEINTRIDEMAAGLSTFSGRNTVGLSAEFISRFEKGMWDLIESTLLRPTLPGDVLGRERSILTRLVKSREDHPSSLCIRSFMKSLFEGHPYAKDPTGDLSSLAKISTEDIAAYDQSCRQAGNLAVAVVGDIDVDRWTQRVSALAEQMAKGPARLKKVQHSGPTADIRKKIDLEKEQSHLIVGYKGLDLADERRWALHVMQAILAGQGGRLFIELRDKKSLAYSVSPLRMEGLGTGYFGAYIGCSPEKTELAEKMILEEFRKIREVAIPEEELTRAKRYVAGRSVIELQKKSAVCGSILFDRLYGNDPHEGLHPEKKINAVTAKEIMDLAHDLFSQPSVTSIVGPGKS